MPLIEAVMCGCWMLHRGFNVR